MVSGDFSVSNNSSGTDTEIRYAEATYPDDNESTVTVSLYARTSVGTFGQGSWVLRVGGQTYTRGGWFSGSSSWERVATVTRSGIPHNSSGAQNIPLGVESGGIPNTSWTSTAGTRDVDLTTFDRSPGAPSGLSSSSGYREISGSWNAASSPGTPILEYQYRYSTNTSYTNGLTLSNGTSRSFTKAVNSDSTRYYWSVRARNAGGWGPWSGNTSIVTGPALPPKPAGLKVTNTGSTVFSVAWSASSGADDYVIEIADNSAFTNAGRNSTSSTDYDTVSKNPGTAYWTRVAARNESGSSAWTVLATSTAPGAPRNLATSDVQTAAATATWSAPSPNGNETITGYDVEVRTLDGTTVDTSTVNGAARTYTSANLDPGETYQFLVRARNNAGAGVWAIGPIFTTLNAGAWLKTAAGWVLAPAWVKTGAGGWTQAMRVWNRDSNGWN